MSLALIVRRSLLSMAMLPAWLLPYPSQALDLPAANPAASQADRCTALGQLRLPDTIVTSATLIGEGEADAAGLKVKPALPPFCRVVAHVRAAPDSDVAVEIWLPTDHWAGVFHGNGNGGFAGTLAAGYPGMVTGLRRGFATATTDTGTAPATALEGDVLVGHPRKWRDWGRLSTHAMTVTGKAIAAAFYGKSARRSFYTGCSTGGQQGLIEAQYYPADYDGILVGAPVINRTWGHAAVLWDFAAANRAPGALLSDDKLRLLNAGAIASCRRQGRALPGDAFVSDPLGCRFDPAELLCRGKPNGQCLTHEEVTTARAFYSGPTWRGGKPAFFGWLPGSEAPSRFGWSLLQTAAHGQPQFGGLFKWVFGSDWDWRQFDFDRDMPIVDRKLGGIVNDAAYGSLGAFRARGGKLILYHGLADTLVPPAQSLAFFNRQARQVGGAQRLNRFAKLFLAPGMTHCAGGAGADAFNSAMAGAAPPAGNGADHDLFQTLIDWTGGASAPQRVIATKYDASGAIAFQRPICAYPSRATYSGSGSPLSPSSFICSRRHD